jgi:hypothetical protein
MVNLTLSEQAACVVALEFYAARYAFNCCTSNAAHYDALQWAAWGRFAGL